jgi:hypothetical protein
MARFRAGAVALALTAVFVLVPGASARPVITVVPVTFPPSLIFSSAFPSHVNGRGEAIMQLVPTDVAVIRKADGTTAVLDDIDRASFPDGPTIGFDLSETGFVAGTTVGPTDDVPWLYDPVALSRTPLPIGTYANGRALGVNDGGTTVGYLSSDRSLSDAVPVAWVGPAHTLQLLPTGTGTGIATGINEHGLVGGTIVPDPAAPTVGNPVSWTLGSSTVTFLAGGPVPNTQMLLVGANDEIQTEHNGQHLVWRPSHIPPLFLGTGEYPDPVSDTGFIVHIVPAPNGAHTVVRFNTMTFEELVVVTVPAPSTVVAHVNNAGQVVFKASPGVSGQPGGDTATLFDPAHGMIDLPAGLDLFSTASLTDRGVFMFVPPPTGEDNVRFVTVDQVADVPPTSTPQPSAVAATPSFTG